MKNNPINLPISVTGKESPYPTVVSVTKEYQKPSQIDFEPRSRSKGKKGTAKMLHIKRTVKEEERRVSIRM